ncbi:glutamate racemase [Sphaerotilus sp.]|uniref:glutamate racemase n=1 Tax=Sphaerotilus sp. TaxID=2093942 RepID=UPI002ACE217D|nr:glutamate racemase [Sphaerotilus sp.]MDZ7856093.1 glutamate racemase [Sphaerotilus sp.]
MTTPAPLFSPRIGVFDSGLGGLSVLRSIRQRLPHAQLLYVADSGHAPYGERGDDYVCDRSLVIADFLYRQGAQLLVIACNTATAAAATAVRARYPDGRIVGVEPGLKPAATQTRNGRVGVMATNGTLRSERFRLLAQAHAAHLDLRLQACTGLAAAIEAGEVDSDAVRERVATHCAALRAQDVDTVVLGCTHYPFVAHHIQAEMGPDVALIDTSDAVARRTATLVESLAASDQTDAEPTAAALWTTGDLPTLQGFVQRWLDFPCTLATEPA